MNFKSGLAIAAVMLGLGTSSVAMEHGHDRDRDHDRTQFHRAAWHHDDHDRKGWEKGKKTGWKDGSLPPGQAKKDSKHWRKEHEREAHEHHRHEMTKAQREAWERRHHSHETVVYKPKPTVNRDRKNGLKTVVDTAKANKERH